MKRTMLLMCLAAVVAAPLAGAARPKAPQEQMAVSINRPAATITLAAALADLESRIGLKIRVDWPSLLEAGVKDDAKLALAATEATGIQLLDSTLAQAAPKGRPLAWYFADDMIMVTTQRRVLHGMGMPERVVAAPADAGRAAPAANPPAVATKTVKFEKTPLADVIEFVRKSSKVNIHVQYEALKAVGVTAETPVTVEAANVSMARLLDMVMEELSESKTKLDSVYWVVNGGVVSISTGTAFNNSRSTTVRMYDVQDLLHVLPDFKGPTVPISSLTSSSVGGSGSSGSSGSGASIFNTPSAGGNAEQSAGKTRAVLEEKLLKLVKDSIGEDMWAPNGAGDVQIWNGKLVISQTPLGFKLIEQASGIR